VLNKFYSHFVVPRIALRAAAAEARRHGLSSFQVVGANMAPTLESGDIVWIDRENVQSIRRGEVVAFNHAEFGDQPVPSRVIAVSGEKVQICDGTLYVNGAPVPEPYIEAGRAEQEYSLETALAHVPEGHVWLLGDFRDMSKDSRNLGSVALAQVMGRVVRAHSPGEQLSPRVVA
jgi:signal peptidase I